MPSEESFGLMGLERNLNDTHFPPRTGKQNAPGGGAGPVLARLKRHLRAPRLGKLEGIGAAAAAVKQ